MTSAVLTTESPNLSKIPSGDFKLQALLAYIERDLQTQTAASNVSLMIEQAPGLPQWLAGDSDTLLKVLNHLLNNALKFSPEGESIVLQVLPCPDSEDLLFKVIDHGPGMAQVQQEKIFSAQIDSKGDTKGDNSDDKTELITSQMLAQQLSGQLSLASYPGKGCCFTLSIPLDDTITKHQPQTLPSTFAADSRVLVVDDHALNLMILNTYLLEFGITTIEASSGPKAIEKTRQLCDEQTPPELILMDMRMPNMDGLEATRDILALNGAAGIPVVALSADAIMEQMGRAAGSGFCRYLAKPIEVPQLHEVLAAYLRPA